MTSDTPIVCSLSAEELPARLAEMASIGADALRGVDPGGALRFRNDEATRVRLEAIVRAESECCSFLSLDLRENGDQLELRIRAPEGAEAIADDLVRAFTAPLRVTEHAAGLREHYASAATQAARGAYDEARRLEATAACGSGGCAPVAAADDGSFGAVLYDEETRSHVPRAAVEASLGCGVPTAVADLHEGETVLDLGSGAGADVLISASRVGPTGKAIGLDMTDEMLDLARANAAEAGADNVEFVRGYIEDVPLADATVDVVISNCVINLAADKSKVLAEAARVLRPGGRFAVSDVIAGPDLDDRNGADMQQWAGCVGRALTRAEYVTALSAAGFTLVEIRETHRVHEHAASAIIRARKPAQPQAA
jgi:arsenite methyltransferase